MATPMSYSVIIPARHASQRFPGKPLKLLAGKPMIEHVYDCAKISKAGRVVVATDDERIYTTVCEFGGEACMTSSDHNSGTDRLEEVARQLKLGDDEIVVNVQGDEPQMPAAVIDQVADNLKKNPQASCATLCELISNEKECLDPNIVKVVKDVSGMALYFSRATIPWDRENLHNECFRHIGIYAYRVSLLRKFVEWPVSELENIEKLEQLRILENGEGIHVSVACETVPGGVDTPEDLNRLNLLMSEQ